MFLSAPFFFCQISSPVLTPQAEEGQVQTFLPADTAAVQDATEANGRQHLPWATHFEVFCKCSLTEPSQQPYEDKKTETQAPILSSSRSG